jgi:predicted membrane metal-binding protein
VLIAWRCYLRCGGRAVTLPAWRDWVFALKVCAAALLALFVALWIYRVYGTLLGAIVSVILIPNLVNAPEVLTVALALWVGLCLYFSLLDRTPSSYVLMLAGYTAAFVGFPAVADPGTIFDIRGGARRGDHPRHPVREPDRINRAAAVGGAAYQDPP